MSLPGDWMPSKARPVALPNPDAQGRDAGLVDYETGGIDLQDPSQGLQVKTWRFRLDGADIKVSADPYIVEQTLLSAALITSLSGAFDQNMRPLVAYIAAGLPWLYWYDPQPAANVYLALPTGVTSLLLSLDDKRPQAGSGNRSDVLLFYVRGNRVCYLQQRDRFTIERVLCWLEGSNATIRRAGMAVNYRMQVELEGVQAALAVGAVLGAYREAVYTDAAVSLALAMPTGLETGDMLHAVFMHRYPATTPGGWTLVTSQACTSGGVTQTVSVYRKTTTTSADSGVSASFTQSTSSRAGLAYFVVRGTPGTTPTYLGAAVLQLSGTATNSITAPTGVSVASELVMTIATSINSVAAVTQPTVAAGMDLISGAASQCRLGISDQRRKYGQMNAGDFTFNLGTPTANGLAAVTLRFGHA